MRLILLGLVWAGAEDSVVVAGTFEFEVGDRIAVLGNGLADRMQHDGWLETLLQARFPERKLSVRHLGFTGDELALRMRSSGFGSPEDWLQRTQASVVFAFFGSNESFRGVDGVPEFKKHLTDFVNQTRVLAETGRQQRRLVLFSPIGCEDLGDPLLPPATEQNRRLAIYANAMAEVAETSGVHFVDLMRPSIESYRRSEEALSINGIHLNEAGNHELATIIDTALFGKATSPGLDDIESLRSAVCDKNFYWFQRYRTTDGYSIFGGRRKTGGSKWTPDNEEVMVREMEVLDAMTANRDRQIWALAQGKNLIVDDSNTPPLITVASNKPGPLGDGSYSFLGGEEAIEKMTLADGLAVNLFASEE